MDKTTEILPTNTLLIDDIRQIINQARNQVAVNVNAELTLMYWHIGERINREVLGNERAEYGKQIVATVSQQLQTEYGDKGFEKSSITRMMKFARLFPIYQIVATLSRQLQEEFDDEAFEPIRDGSLKNAMILA